MSARRASWSPALVISLLTVAVAAGGCGSGDTVPLMPPGGATEWPPDPRWQTVVPLSGDRQPLGVAWRPAATRADTRAVIVGEAGLALHFDGERWLRGGTGQRHDLRAAVAAADGRFWAVGADGAGAVCDDGVWSAVPLGTHADLDQLAVRGAEIWAGGAEGAVLHHDGDGWRDISLPDPLRVRALTTLPDTLLAADDGGGLWGRVAGAWTSLGAGPWGARPVGGLAVPADGRLYALSDSLYRREPNGWSTVAAAHWWVDGASPRSLQATDDWLWMIIDRTLIRLDVNDPLENLILVTDTDVAPAAVAASTANLTIRTDGYIRWIDDEGRRHSDPAGWITGYLDWARLEHDPGLVLTSGGVHEVSPTGIRLVVPPPPEAVAVSFPVRAVCGAHRGDFTGATSRALVRYRDGVWTQLASWDESRDIDGLGRDSRGDFVMVDGEGVHRWDGAAWETVAHTDEIVFEFHLHRGVTGQLVAWSPRGAIFLERAGDWILLRNFLNVRDVISTHDGDVVVLGQPGGDLGNIETLALTRPGSGRFDFYSGPDLGALATANIAGGHAGGGEILVWTRSPAMVFRLAGLVGTADWELVAGPLGDHIHALEMQPDGSLLAVSQSERRIYRYTER